MRKLPSSFVAAAAVGVSAQQEPPRRQRHEPLQSVHDRMGRSNPNLAASTRYFTGAEQDASSGR